MSKMDPDKEVPEYFIDNELKKYLNQNFDDPHIPLKESDSYNNQVEKSKGFKRDIKEIAELYQDFFDDFEFDKWHENHEGNLTYINNLGSQFQIERSYHYEAECIRIRIQFGGNDRLLKSDTNGFKDFTGISNEKLAKSLEDCHQRVITVMSPVDFLVGSLGKDLDIIYFLENPNFERYKGVNIFGSNYQLEIPHIGNLTVNSRHSNIISIDLKVKGNKGVISCCLMSYLDGNYYYLPNAIFPHIIMYRYDGTPVEKWIEDEWVRICQKLKIRRSTKGKGTIVAHPEQVIPAEFMVWLKDNIDNLYKSAGSRG